MVNQKYRKWTPEEEEYLRENYGSQTYRDMGKHLSRTADNVKTKAVLMGLGRPKGCMANNRKDNAYMIKLWRELDENVNTNRHRKV